MLDFRRIILITLICLAVTVGLLVAIRTGGAAVAKPAARGITLMVHAGAGLRPALDEAGKAFAKKTGIGSSTTTRARPVCCQMC